jgi:two-component system, NarL family, nitrate/nitrite response regulator NarL
MEIRVLVASEVRLYREGLRRVLQDVAGIALVGIAASAEEVVAQACGLMPPTVVLLDVGLAESLALIQNFGGAPHIPGIVIVGAPEIDAETVAALPFGVLGYVMRDGSESDLLETIHAAARGEVRQCRRPAVPPLSSGARRSHIEELTARETEILRLMQQGLSNKMLSRRLGIELSTVKNHVHSILAKLSARSRGEAISLLYRHDELRRTERSPAKESLV